MQKYMLIYFHVMNVPKIIIQSGIKEVVYLSDKYADSENNIASRKLFDCCGVKYRKIDLKEDRKIEIELK